ncbi:MAG: 23S rRNA (pseudouridine(1915)-N(3))-methyltransferase RlmH [Spirochaetota bacterium]
MTIQVLAVGKLGKGYLREGVADYSERIRRHCKFEIIEVGESKSHNPREKEGQMLLEKLGKTERAYCIALHPAASRCGSEELARHLETLQTQGVSRFVFMVGGSEGLSAAVLQRADMRLSFSALTFPHQLFRLLLCEQIYRCLKMNGGQTYHK